MIRLAVAMTFMLMAAMSSAAGFGAGFGSGFGDILGGLMGRSGVMGKESTIDEALAKVTSQINKNTPITVDKETRLDKVTAEPGKHMIYHYTLVGVSSRDINPPEFQNAVRPVLKSRLCSSAEMQNFLKSGVKISYVYRSNDNQPLGGVEFTPKDCGYKV